MVTNARKVVSARFLIWMLNVTTGMDSVTVNLDIPVYTVIKVCQILYFQLSVESNAPVLSSIFTGPR